MNRFWKKEIQLAVFNSLVGVVLFLIMVFMGDIATEIYFLACLGFGATTIYSIHSRWNDENVIAMNNGVHPLHGSPLRVALAIGWFTFMWPLNTLLSIIGLPLIVKQAKAEG